MWTIDSSSITQYNKLPSTAQIGLKIREEKMKKIKGAKRETKSVFFFLNFWEAISNSL